MVFSPKFLAGNGIPVTAVSSQSFNVYPRQLGDVNRDGRADIVWFEANGTSISFGQADGKFSAPVLQDLGLSNKDSWTSFDLYPRLLGDVNGDGRADIVAFSQFGVEVSLATTSTTAPFSQTRIFNAINEFGVAQGWNSFNTYPRQLGDVNGDGRVDIVGFGVNGTSISFGQADGKFSAPVLQDLGLSNKDSWTSFDLYPRLLGDVNGDGRADIVAFSQFGVEVSLATTSTTAPFSQTRIFNAINEFGVAQGWNSFNTYPRQLGDVNGDGRVDIVGFKGGNTYVAYGQADGKFSRLTVGQNDFNMGSFDANPRLVRDVNGDRLADIVAFEGNVFVALALPSITLRVSPSSVPEDGTSNLIYTFSRTGSITNALTVNLGVAGTATFNNDYTQSGAATFSSTAGTITFAPGSRTATLTIDPTADTVFENNETVSLRVATGTGYAIGTSTAVTGTIANDDLPSITLQVSPSSVPEDGTSNLIYTFNRTGSIANALTVNLGVAGTAIFNNDYTQSGAATFSSTAGTITFAPGSRTATLTIDPTADTVFEDNENVSLKIATGTGYTIGTSTAVTGTIANDDSQVAPPSISLAILDSVVAEDGTRNLRYQFSRNTTNLSNPLTVNFSVGGNATFNTDYVARGAAAFSATTGQITFATGESNVILDIDPTPDTTVEPDESVALTLSSGTGYTVGTSTPVTGTILNDDTTAPPSVTLAVAPSSVLEDGTSNLIYTFTRTGSTANPLTVNFGVAGTATFNNDYTQSGAATFSSTAGTITFAPGQDRAELSIDPTPDTVAEPDETVALTLNPGTGYAVGTSTPVTGTIANASYIVGGYISSWNLRSDTPLASIPSGKLTHLFYSFANVQPNGTVTLPSDAIDDFGNDIDKLKAIKAQNPNLKVLLSVGGADELDFSAAVASGAAPLAQSMIQLMKTQDFTGTFDGIDIDWEFPKANEDGQYIELLRQLRQQLNQASQSDGKQYLLTTAFSASPYVLTPSDYADSPHDFSPQDLKATSDLVDFINVMTYDYHGSWENTTNHQSPLYRSSNDSTYNAAKLNTDWSIRHYLQAGIPAKDIVLGIPLYGYRWNNVDAGSFNGLYQSGTPSGKPTYRQLSNELRSTGREPSWDDSAKIPYIYNSQGLTFSTYENQRSVLGKTDYVKQQGIGGAFFWEVTGDYPLSHPESLVKAAANNLGLP